jgi:hypothetical protein
MRTVESAFTLGLDRQALNITDGRPGIARPKPPDPFKGTQNPSALRFKCGLWIQGQRSVVGGDCRIPNLYITTEWIGANEVLAGLV